MSKKIVILTEKRDQAQKLADAMGWSKGQGCWTGKFEGKSVTVVCARGHLITFKNPDEIMPGIGWDKPEKLLPMPTAFPVKVIDADKDAAVHLQAKTYVSNIKKHLDQADEMIIATDSDREGEAIGWTVKEWLNFNGPVRRAWFAAGLDKKSMKEAMANLRDPSVTKGYYRASQARGRSDWLYQLIVRAYSHYASYSCLGPNLGQGSGRSSVVSTGRVQTPTLSMVVDRDLEIENFVEKDHFKVFSNFLPAGERDSIVGEYKPVVTEEVIGNQPPGVVWEPSKKQPKDGEPEPLDIPLFVGKTEVDAFERRLIDAGETARITSYKEASRSEAPPKTFALTDAVNAVSSAARVDGGLAQTILEDLYEQGWTSYARTSKAEIPMNLYEDSERNGMLESVMSIPEVSAQAKEAQKIHNGQHDKYKKFKPAIFVNKSMEHYGIVPTTQKMTEAAFNSLTPKKREGKTVRHTKSQMQEAYKVIAKRFVQVLYPPAKYATQKIDFEVPVEDLLGNPSSMFKASGERMVDPGWRTAFNESSDKDTSVAKQKEGNLAKITDIELKKLRTKPPARFTATSLQKAMETIAKTVRDPKLRALLKESEGIGTPATRKTVIETLVSRGYLEEKGKTLISTPKGRDLIKVVPKWLSDPATTALWEDYLVKIANEKDDQKSEDMRDQFVTKQTAKLESLLKTLIETYNSNLGEKVVRGPSKVTAPMKKLIKSVAERKGIKVPTGTLTDPQKAKKFLDEHIEKRDPNKVYPPSDKQITLLDKIISGLPEGTPVPQDVKTNGKSCSAFIDLHIKNSPPSAGQIKFAQDLISQMPEGEEPPKGVLEKASICKKFIDDRLKKGKKSSSKPKGKGTKK